MEKYGIVKVGGGRGFVVVYNHERLIITAAHCLRELPAFDGWAEDDAAVIVPVGPIGVEPSMGAVVRFVDPIGDIAILGSPDNQELYDEAEAYDSLVESVTPLAIARAVNGKGYLIALGGEVFDCEVTVGPNGRLLWLAGEAQPILRGASGSPILSPEGYAVGIVSKSYGPALTAALPGWFLENIEHKEKEDA